MHSASHTDYGRSRRSEEEEEKSKPTKLLLLIILWGWTITLSFVSREREMIIISGLLFSARRVQMQSNLQDLWPFKTHFHGIMFKSIIWPASLPVLSRSFAGQN